MAETAPMMNKPQKSSIQVTSLPNPPRWDISGPPYRYTREELLDILKTAGYELSDRQLRSWAAQGLIPRPERRLPPGATDGVARAIYPKYTLAVLLSLLQHARDGATIGELKALAPKYEDLFRSQPEDEPSSISNPPIVHISASRGRIAQPLTWKRGNRALERAITSYAEQYEKRRGVALTEAVLTLRTADGEEVNITFRPPQTQEE